MFQKAQEILAQTTPGVDVVGWFQTGGMASVAAVLLWVFIRERHEFLRALNSIAITNLTFQQMLLALNLTQSTRHTENSEVCTECQRRLAALEQLIDAQTNQLREELKK